MGSAKLAIPRWNGGALKILRESRAWSMDRLGELVGVNRSQVRKWESSKGDKNRPTANYVGALAVLFNAPLMTFYRGVDTYREVLLRFEAAGSMEPDDKERLREMKTSPLPGRRFRAQLSADQIETPDADQGSVVDDQEPPPELKR